MHELLEVDLGEALAHGFGAHLGLETLAVLLHRVVVLGLTEQLQRLERRIARVGDQVILVIEHALQGVGRQVQHQPDAAGAALEEPDMRNGHGQLDMTHALPAHARDGDLDAATVAHHALVLDALVLAAGALPVPRGAEDALAKQAVALRAVGPVVDGLRILDLAVTPRANRLRRRQGDADCIILAHIRHAKQFSCRVGIQGRSPGSPLTLIKG